jgi:hypothetical protein
VEASKFDPLAQGMFTQRDDGFVRALLLAEAGMLDEEGACPA